MVDSDRSPTGYGNKTGEDCLSWNNCLVKSEPDTKK